MDRRLVVFGLSLSSSWGNGHATTYRGLLRALADRGWQCTFFEWDTEWYRPNRDLASPTYCDLRFYEDWDAATRAIAAHVVRGADAVMVGSYAGHATAIVDWLATLPNRPPTFFYDIDTPITLTAFHAEGAAEYLRADQVSFFDTYLSFTGGPALIELEQTWGARRAVALYCGVDESLYAPAAPDPRFEGALGYMGTYAADRQPKLERLLLEPAANRPQWQFLVAGSQYPALDNLPANVSHLSHVAPGEHAAFYSTPWATLNLTREAMVRYGWSPSVRLFEAAACGACIISDSWPGLDELLRPGEEILLATRAEDVLWYLDTLATDTQQARRIGEAARQRILSDHTYARRAVQFEEIYLGALHVEGAAQGQAA